MPFEVMKGEPTAFSGIKAATVLAVGLCVWISLAPAALAGPLGSLNGLFGHHSSDGRETAAPPVARYVTEDGDVFTFDRTQPKALLKFDNSFEVWALQPQPAPRGDTIYKNDLGEPVLRATRLGGVTLFTDQRPGGAAAALAGVASPLKLAIMGPQALLERLAQASARASHAARRLIPFEAEANPTSAPLIADAAMVTSEAVVRMTKRSDARKLLDHILKVHLVEGSRASAQVDPGGVLEVTVAPPQGLAGRPSSDRIVQVTQGFH
ncbi:DUF4908 domain-containing protein [Phenylobacterium sp.]|uniref:DUF4908 domain-containing protein n=1 Tax=Phenylobacterium sp. TaxID=1871053 RepID=UPI0025E66819|nr:DUF4908 domain-containing protein [Phenylobacterium sp.]